MAVLEDHRHDVHCLEMESCQDLHQVRRVGCKRIKDQQRGSKSWNVNASCCVLQLST